MATRTSPFVDAAVAAYCAAHSAPPPDAVEQRLIARTAELGSVANMQIGSDQGVFLAMLVAATGARLVVEIGTFTGYSALCMARALPERGRLVACDVSEEWTAIGREAWEEAGVADRIDLRIGPALATLQSMPADPPIDLAFVDADKPNYGAYVDELLLRLRPSGLILVDNTLWSGRVVEPDPEDDYATAIAAFNDAIAADDRVDSVILPLGDGVTMLRKRS
jgi:caffeoyl-CoA O-methyltransferase